MAESVVNKEAARRLRSMTIAVRTAGDPLAMAARIRQQLRDVELQLPVLPIHTVEQQQLNGVLVQERLIALRSSFFGSLALLLACVGLYGVISYGVTTRTAENRARCQVACHPADDSARAFVLVVAGLAVGIPFALAAGRVMRAQLFELSPYDPTTTVTATLAVPAVTILAGYVPARRASRVDAMVALRSE